MSTCPARETGEVREELLLRPHGMHAEETKTRLGRLARA
jgi:hypothetical protein